jgi:hypothetical protein
VSALTGADFALFWILLKLESRIDVAPGTFVENNKPKIRQSTIYYAWSLERWDKLIVDRESDVPSIIFLYFL